MNNKKVLSKDIKVDINKVIITEQTQSELTLVQLEQKLQQIRMKKTRLKEQNQRLIEEYNKLTDEENEVDNLISQLHIDDSIEEI